VEGCPITALDRPIGLQEDEAPRISRHSICHPYAPAAFTPHEIFLVLISVRGGVNPQDPSAAGRIISMKVPNVPIGNRTRDFPACSAVPQPTTAPLTCVNYLKSLSLLGSNNFSKNRHLLSEFCFRKFKTFIYMYIRSSIQF
jgi:hypothetical protein